MDAKQVTPGKWHNPNYPIRVLYDDGSYSLIWGKFEGTPAMGTRWNGDGNSTGYPSLAGNPTWYVEPDFVAKSILAGLLSSAVEENDMEYFENIKFAIVELNKKMGLHKQTRQTADLDEVPVN